ncbi:Egg cell-secreted-like protein [Citrus sinensis]|nr:egg cell-secreted protein 1.4 [Citrus x clementina]KAH9653450.1 Egg cell-secreted-like protein [Citrus sinensis]
MAQVISFRYSFALILTCSFMMAAPGLASVTFENPLIEGGQDPDVAKCLSTLESVHGCVQEVITAFLSLKVNLIGNACCKAFNEVDTNCWPKVFPFDPFFPPLLQSYCTTIVKNGPPTSIPQKQQNAPSPSPALFKRLE